MAYYYEDGTGLDANAYLFARVEVTVTNTNATTCSVTVSAKVVSDSGSSNFISGRATNSANDTYGAWSSEMSVSAYGSRLLSQHTFNVSRGSKDKSIICRANIAGGGTGMYSGTTDTASVYATIPAIAYEKPNAPTNASATYVSDSSATVTWTNGSTTTARPRTATIVERSTDGGSFVQIATVSSSATSYTDGGISANHSYAYQLSASNSAGRSSSVQTSTIYTTPAAPTSVSVDKVTATSVQVNATADAPYSEGYDVERSLNGGDWEAVASSAALPITDSVGGGTVQYRVRTVRGSLASAWTLSASLVTITPPLAPTITQQPSNPSASGSTATIAWTPNHPDGSAQESAQIKVTSPSGTSQTYTVTTATSYTFTPNATGTWSVQVRTKGLDPSYGAWSSSASWGVYDAPIVTIDSPATDGTEVEALPLYISWSVTDSTGVSAQRVVISNAGGTIYNQTQAASVRLLSLTDSDVALQNGSSYTITVRVMGGSGLITETVRTFSVDWASPASPILDIEEGVGGSASIIATAGEVGAASNLSPFFSMPLSSSYWEATSGITELPDGWARASVDNATGTDRKAAIFIADTIPTELQTSTEYTILVEMRNVGGSATLVIGDWAIRIDGTNVIVRDGRLSVSGSNASIDSAYGIEGTDITFPIPDVFAEPLSATVQSGSTYLVGNTRASLSDADCFVCGQVIAEAGDSASLELRLSIYEGDYSGSYVPFNAPTTEGITVQRINPDGSVWTVAQNLPSGGTAIDPLPPLGVPVTYKAIAMAQSGAASSATYTETIGGMEWMLNFGASAGDFIATRYNPQNNDSLETGGEKYHFARGKAGGGLGVWYSTDVVDIAGSWSFASIDYGISDSLYQYAWQNGTAWLRDPFGHRWRAHISPSRSRGFGRLVDMSIDWDALEFEEAW